MPTSSKFITSYHSLYRRYALAPLNLLLYGKSKLSFLFFVYRIESIGSLEVQGKFDTVQRKQVTLVDNEGIKMKFLLWGEQVLLANLFTYALELDLLGVVF